jgi:CRP-like cAMP-binding protein
MSFFKIKCCPLCVSFCSLQHLLFTYSLSQGDRLYIVIHGTLNVYNQPPKSRSDCTVNRSSLAPLLKDVVSDVLHAKAVAGSRRPLGKRLGTLGPGDHFGEMSILVDIPRSATVKTKSSCLLISVARSHFKNLIKINPEVGTMVHKLLRQYMLTKLICTMVHSPTLKNMVKHCVRNSRNFF